MKDEHKTQEQLVSELAQLRQRVAELEAREAQHKRAEEALRESEEKYRHLVERANDGIAIVQDGVLKYLNPRYAEMLSYTVEEMIGTPASDYIWPDEVAKLLDLYERRLAGKDVTPRYETALRHRDGRKIEIELNAGIITYQGRPADFVFGRDITERKRAEEALQESEANFRALAENANDGIVIATGAG
ncbi:MAG: PAS domain S-box protein, partial [Chloroflexota bacterium]|nr:PAS domain S-box protein [Chloroflexota bacterium]